MIHYLHCFMSITVVLLSIPLGTTYDRCIMVDEEEASIMLYDIWEQVCYPYGFYGCRIF